MLPLYLVLFNGSCGLTAGSYACGEARNLMSRSNILMTMIFSMHRVWCWEVFCWCSRCSWHVLLSVQACPTFWCCNHIRNTPYLIMLLREGMIWCWIAFVTIFTHRSPELCWLQTKSRMTYLRSCSKELEIKFSCILALEQWFPTWGSWPLGDGVKEPFHRSHLGLDHWKMQIFILQFISVAKLVMK